MDIELLISDLELLANIKIGDTIDVDTKTLLPRNSWQRWSSGLWMFGRDEGRTKTVTFIEGICEKTNIYYRKLSLSLIELAAKGIENLTLTYASDINIVGRLRTSKEKLDRLWLQRKKTTPLFIPGSNSVHEYLGHASSLPSYHGTNYNF